MTAPPIAPVRLDFEEPAWLRDFAFTLRETSECVAVPFPTVQHWLHVSKWQGNPLTVKRRHRRLLTGHGVYQVAILAALHKQGIPATPDIIAQVHRVTHRDDKPVLPSLGEQAWLAETDLDGAPVARIEVELWAIWANLESKLAALVADTTKENA